MDGWKEPLSIGSKNWTFIKAIGMPAEDSKTVRTLVDSSSTRGLWTSLSHLGENSGPASAAEGL